MKQVVGIVDYGQAGNTFNIYKLLETLDDPPRIFLIRQKSQFANIDKLILPGVGAYPDAMAGIAGFIEELIAITKKKPVLGICLGMQILSEKGYEFEQTKGLGILAGEVMRLAVNERIPHIGWAKVETIKPSRLLKGITEQDYFYFMHSYEFINYKDVVGLSRYGVHSFVSVVEQGMIFGVQFHPEKSRESGRRIFKNFLAV